jgi:hypothetical protein
MCDVCRGVFLHSACMNKFLSLLACLGVSRFTFLANKADGSA